MILTETLTEIKITYKIVDTSANIYSRSVSQDIMMLESCIWPNSRSKLPSFLRPGWRFGWRNETRQIPGAGLAAYGCTTIYVISMA